MNNALGIAVTNPLMHKEQTNKQADNSDQHVRLRQDNSIIQEINPGALGFPGKLLVKNAVIGSVLCMVFLE